MARSKKEEIKEEVKAPAEIIETKDEVQEAAAPVEVEPEDKSAESVEEAIKNGDLTGPAPEEIKETGEDAVIPQTPVSVDEVETIVTTGKGDERLDIIPEFEPEEYAPEANTLVAQKMFTAKDVTENVKVAHKLF